MWKTHEVLANRVFFYIKIYFKLFCYMFKKINAHQFYSCI